MVLGLDAYVEMAGFWRSFLVGFVAIRIRLYCQCPRKGDERFVRADDSIGHRIHGGVINGKGIFIFALPENISGSHVDYGVGLLAFASKNIYCAKSFAQTTRQCPREKYGQSIPRLACLPCTHPQPQFRSTLHRHTLSLQ
ncbi:unnamed protein product [Periconia digitata]|uniref:Uncharacterized protein n=1 Tax=Periconia digitata TaxID=1303443 RepID=A0A9W4UC41_9PLEO|nr:unnamed protein product [Periconia digitata]